MQRYNWMAEKRDEGVVVMYSDAMEELNKRDNLIVEQGMQIEQTYNALNGSEISDFAMSFGLISKACDRIQEITTLCDTVNQQNKEIAALKAERAGAFEKWKTAIAKYPNGADGCCCLFDEDQNQIGWCSVHAELRDEIAALKAELVKYELGYLNNAEAMSMLEDAEARVLRLQAKLSRLTAALNDDERAEKVVTSEPVSDWHVDDGHYTTRLKAISDYRTALKEAI